MNTSNATDLSNLFSNLKLCSPEDMTPLNIQKDGEIIKQPKEEEVFQLVQTALSQVSDDTHIDASQCIQKELRRLYPITNANLTLHLTIGKIFKKKVPSQHLTTAKPVEKKQTEPIKLSPNSTQIIYNLFCMLQKSSLTQENVDWNLKIKDLFPNHELSDLDCKITALKLQMFDLFRPETSASSRVKDLINFGITTELEAIPFIEDKNKLFEHVLHLFKKAYSSYFWGLAHLEMLLQNPNPIETQGLQIVRWRLEHLLFSKLFYASASLLVTCDPIVRNIWNTWIKENPTLLKYTPESMLLYRSLIIKNLLPAELPNYVEKPPFNGIIESIILDRKKSIELNIKQPPRAQELKETEPEPPALKIKTRAKLKKSTLLVPTQEVSSEPPLSSPTPTKEVNSAKLSVTKSIASKAALMPAARTIYDHIHARVERWFLLPQDSSRLDLARTFKQEYATLPDIAMQHIVLRHIFTPSLDNYVYLFHQEQRNIKEQEDILYTAYGQLSWMNNIQPVRIEYIVNRNTGCLIHRYCKLFTESRNFLDPIEFPELTASPQQHKNIKHMIGNEVIEFSPSQQYMTIYDALNDLILKIYLPTKENS